MTLIYDLLESKDIDLGCRIEKMDATFQPGFHEHLMDKKHKLNVILDKIAVAESDAFLGVHMQDNKAPLL